MVDVNIDYGSLGDALERAGVIPAPAQLHGEICGVMCSGGVAASRRWLDDALREYAIDTPVGRQARDRLHELETDTWHRLAGADMSFEPLLPDDDRPLPEQVQALASWCQGFLTGLGLGGLAAGGEQALSAEVEEIMSDFAEISRAGVTEEEADAPEQSAFALAEVKEYVRVSVQILFEELARARGEREKASLH